MRKWNLCPWRGAGCDARRDEPGYVPVSGSQKPAEGLNAPEGAPESQNGSERRLEAATEYSTKTSPDPLPNHVNVSQFIFTAACDRLVRDPRTSFRNGTALAFDVSNFEHVGYMFMVDEDHHIVRVVISLSEELGMCMVSAVGAYAVALSLDREAWVAGAVPKRDSVEDALTDCCNVLADVIAEEKFIPWLIDNVTEHLNAWLDVLREKQRELAPKPIGEA